MHKYGSKQTKYGMYTCSVRIIIPIYLTLEKQECLLALCRAIFSCNVTKCILWNFFLGGVGRCNMMKCIL